MELKAWTYEEFPEFTRAVEGAKVQETTGEELACRYIPDMPYGKRGGYKRHLQILLPESRMSRTARLDAGANGLAVAAGPTVPCLVYVQGSAWGKQVCTRDLTQLARLTGRGIAVAIVEYREAELAPFPAQCHDAQAALRFIHRHAKRFGIDPNKLVLGGSSSGGHTAVMAAIVDQEDGAPASALPCRGILNLYGAVSFMHEDGYPSTVDGGQPTSPEGMLMGGVNLHEHPELCQAASAVPNITAETSLPPMLIAHGTKDRTVNCELSAELFEHLRATGHDAELVLVKGADHGGPDFWIPEMIDRYEAFIRRCVE